MTSILLMLSSGAAAGVAIAAVVAAEGIAESTVMICAGSLVGNGESGLPAGISSSQQANLMLLALYRGLQLFGAITRSDVLLLAELLGRFFKQRAYQLAVAVYPVGYDIPLGAVPLL